MYYLWLKDAQSGPYTLHQVQAMWNQGQITGLTLYWQEGQAEWLPLSEIQSTIENAKPPLPKTTAALATPDSTPTEANGEEVHWTGHPTWWKWTGLMIVSLILCLLPVSLALFNLPLAIVASPTIVIGLMSLLYIGVIRNATTFTVTNKRISMEKGIFNKTSRELRIKDIRSIAAKTNLLGYGDIEFSSAASDDAEVTFVAVPRAAAVRDLVKKLQS